MTYPRACAVAYAVAGVGGIAYAVHNGTVFDEVLGSLWTVTCLIGIAFSLRTIRPVRTMWTIRTQGTNGSSGAARASGETGTSRDVVPPAIGTPSPRSRVIRKVPTHLR